MAVIIEMPKLSDTMTTGTLVSWLKNEGDPVASGDVLAEVETDKATMELENFEEGILLKQYIGVGEQVPIGSAIAAIGEKGEDVPEVPAVVAKPEAEEAAVEKKVEAPKAAVAAPTPPAPIASGGRIKASPLAKKIAEEKGISLESISGTGPDGRIVKADVLAALEKGPAAVGAPTPAAVPVSMGAAVAAEVSQPVSGMRATIARRLVESKTQIPHFYLDIEVDAAPLMELRAGLNKNLADLPPEQGGIKFTVNDFILKATAEALRRVPSVNASWQGTTIQQFGGVHLAFGVAVEEGLLTPVIRDAHEKTLRQVSRDAKELISKARSKKLSPAEMTGSTFTVTNLGMFGINNFYGIINPPNAGILSVGATIKKPVVNEAGDIVVGQRMNIGFSGDHRVVDGASGAQFLNALKSVLEAPALMLV